MAQNPGTAPTSRRALDNRTDALGATLCSGQGTVVPLEGAARGGVTAGPEQEGGAGSRLGLQERGEKGAAELRASLGSPLLEGRRKEGL